MHNKILLSHRKEDNPASSGNMMELESIRTSEINQTETQIQCDFKCGI